jgi:replicative DNA helicase
MPKVMAETVQKNLDTETTSLKIPPHSIEAEQAILGGLFLDHQAWEKVAELLSADDFYRRDHQLIFTAISRLDADNKPYDLVTVAEWLENNQQLDDAGGLSYLAALADSTPGASNIKTYAEIVRNRSILRQLIRATTDISASVFNPLGRSSNEILDNAEQTIFQIAEQESRGRKNYSSIKDLLVNTLDRIDELYQKKSHITGIASGFTDFDRQTAGLQKSDLIIVAGRPSNVWRAALHEDDVLAGPNRST